MSRLRAETTTRTPVGGISREQLDARRESFLREQCALLRVRLSRKDPAAVARSAAMALSEVQSGSGRGDRSLTGHLWGRRHTVTWPDLEVRDRHGVPVPVRDELLWLHYLDRADGTPLSGRLVTLRELGGGGLFYHRAFQGYTGDELARSWDGETGGLAGRCAGTGGWKTEGPADLNFEWQVLPRVPLYLSYRAPVEDGPARAEVLFDATTGHYLAVDAAAILGRELVRLLGPGPAERDPEETQ